MNLLNKTEGLNNMTLKAYLWLGLVWTLNLTVFQEIQLCVPVSFSEKGQQKKKEEETKEVTIFIINNFYFQRP
jgi:hypothetical protein